MNEAQVINELAQQAHATAVEKGWWGDDSAFPVKIALIHSETSEALEAWRESKDGDDWTTGSIKFDLSRAGNWTMSVYGDDVMIHRRDMPDEILTWEQLENFLKIQGVPYAPVGVPSELADIIIRVLDLAAAYGIDIGKAVVSKMEYNKSRPEKHGGKRA